MKRRMLWLLLSCLMLTALLVMSCAPAVTEKEAAPVEEEVVTGERGPTFEKPFSIGETAQSSRLAVTILEANVIDTYEYYSKISKEMKTHEAGPDRSFLLVAIEIENVGAGRTGPEGSTKMNAYDSEVPRYRVTPYFGEGRLYDYKHLDPGEKISGKVLFHIRKEATGLTVQYLEDYPAPVFAEWKVK